MNAAQGRQTVESVCTEATHNMSGQRLGPKGLGTRERIVKAMLDLVESDDETPITLSAVARKASVRMSNLYLYFPDLGELLLAALRRAVDEQDLPYMRCLRDRWPDGELSRCCEIFVHAYFHFWQSHARLLQMRNNLADARDMRLIDYRNRISAPLITLLLAQMDALGEEGDNGSRDCATALVTGLERMATVVINPDFAAMTSLHDKSERTLFIGRLACAEAKIIEYTVSRLRQQREAVPTITFSGRAGRPT
ncbi:MAG TPA: TetR/AcrR family transcriptional regulator [Sphingobium sp.]